MIRYEELNPNKYVLTTEQARNILILIEKINVIREKWGHPMIVTSGIRSPELQKKIYLEKGFEEKDIPMGSAHLQGLAVDIQDTNKELYTWCTNNNLLLIQLGLYIEDGKYTDGWIHFQAKRPKSGNVFFKPY